MGHQDAAAYLSIALDTIAASLKAAPADCARMWGGRGRYEVSRRQRELVRCCYFALENHFFRQAEAVPERVSSAELLSTSGESTAAQRHALEQFVAAAADARWVDFPPTLAQSIQVRVTTAMMHACCVTSRRSDVNLCFWQDAWRILHHELAGHNRTQNMFEPLRTRSRLLRLGCTGSIAQQASPCATLPPAPRQRWQ